MYIARFDNMTYDLNQDQFADVCSRSRRDPSETDNHHDHRQPTFQSCSGVHRVEQSAVTQIDKRQNTAPE